MFLVTGPTGNIGAELSQFLVEENPAGLDFRLAAHHPDDVRARYGDHVDVALLDYDDRSTWGPALEGVTVLFLLFPLPHPRTVKSWMLPFIEAAKAAGVQHVIYISVPGAERSKIVPHNRVEQAIKESGLGWTILKPSYFMQNLVRSISTHGVDIADNDEIFIPAGQSTTTFVDSRDVAEVVSLVAADPKAHDGQVYLLTGEHKRTYFEVAEALSEVLGREIRYTHPSRLAFWRRLRKRGVSRDTVFFMEIVYTLARRGANNPVSDDLPRLLGKEPRTIQQFAEDYRWRWEERVWT